MVEVSGEHIRGRIGVCWRPATVRIPSTFTWTVGGRPARTRQPRAYWRVQVINTATGQVIASDDHFGTLASAIEATASDVEAARRAWSLDWRRSDLRAKP